MNWRCVQWVANLWWAAVLGALAGIGWSAPTGIVVGIVYLAVLCSIDAAQLGERIKWRLFPRTRP